MSPENPNKIIKTMEYTMQIIFQMKFFFSHVNFKCKKM